MCATTPGGGGNRPGKVSVSRPRKVARMSDESKTPRGMKLLLSRCRQRFRIPENLEHYSEEDLREAEKKFVKFCLMGGQVPTHQE